MEDATFGRTMLFDFYGELLTDKQREYFDLHYNEDLSLGEIAEQTGISRQGVWDIIRRAEAALMETEKKIGLVGRFLEQRKVISDMQDKLKSLSTLTDGEAARLVESLSEELKKL